MTSLFYLFLNRFGLFRFANFATMFQLPQIASTCAVANGNKINNKFWLRSAGDSVANLRLI